MYQIQGMGLSQNTTKILYVVEEIGADYELIPIDLSKGEHKQPEHLARHPLGKVPTLTHNGQSLFESAAICQYIATVEKSALYPSDPYKTALINQWMDYFSIHLGRWLSTLLFEKHFKPAFGLGETNPESVKEAQGFVAQQMQALDAQLGKHAFVAGDDLSIADCHGYAYIETKAMSGVSIDEFPNVSRWFNDYSARASVKRVHAKIGR